MRRRSERKKSTSPAPLPARRSRRSRKVSENERAEEDSVVHKDAENQEMTEVAATREEINDAPDRERASSEERAASPSPVRKSRSSRTTPKKRVESKSSDKKVETIPEEGENGADSDKCQSSRNNADAGKREKREKSEKRTPLAADIVDESKSDAEPAADPQPKQEPEAEVEKPQPEPGNAKKDVKDVDKSDDEKPTQDDDHDDDGRRRQSIHIQEVKVPSPSISLTASKEEEHLKTSSDVLDIQTEDVEERDDEAVAAAAVDADAAAAAAEDTPKSERREERKRKHKEQLPIKTKDEQKENRKQSIEQPAPAQDEAIDLPNNNKHETSVTATPPTAPAGAAAGVLQSQRSVRKRKWLTNKKSTDRAPPVLAISTDSLKNIISDVVPVPLSDVQLDSSSEEEGLVTSDHESDRSVSPLVRKERERECDESGTVTVVTATDNSVAESNAAKDATAGTGRTTPALATDIVQVHVGKSTVPSAKPNVVRSPSPARNRSSHVLYITNLVRPFTVLQLKGLLARTGKIVEDGFWIDRIKSKCFVAYSNEDEAIETRHALHGVRWPVSNPKCLNVDFGSRTDMDRAIQLTKDEPPRYGQENTRDNQQAGSAWSRLDATDKKPARPVREWDVGKKEPNDRDKVPNDRRRGSKERVVDSRSRDVERPGQDRKRSREGEGVRGRERERIERNNDRNAHGRSRSGSPLPKTKRKENEPPIRLLDDLFRKTKITPCIYWLPLTPEAIAEKEAFRQKRIEEHKLRIKEREERQKEREKERDRQRDTRRNRSNERRHSRSRERERRRY
ncbi:apoptotic chromatin condensation inducer in the nucleus isoform X1 [Drosophila subobscura]|uniref:apoptotic chromatin condensation inducer in the nucleus isoform X1 n=1 Tax=Drosophila subobscura TaxID=7241 RepID=UPI00155A75F3|nr:apoptotic chromatin condensation inducer in the nucleus isoform X1 [Drosophila subobscura]XP_034667797.1 apoptotic chromatin condensation inducer in the nucleus isoform X1 [Drosophila subobscura]